MWKTAFDGVDRRLLQALRQSSAQDNRRLELGWYNAEVLYSSAGDGRRLLIIGKAVDHLLELCEDRVEYPDHSVTCWVGATSLSAYTNRV